MIREHAGSMARRAALLVSSLLLVALLAVPSHAAPTVIRGHAVSWSPATVIISRGGVVKWRSIHLTHDVYAYGSNWTFGAPLPEGASAKRRFTRRGTYRFRCTLHSSLVGGACNGMCGQVRVV